MPSFEERAYAAKKLPELASLLVEVQSEQVPVKFLADDGFYYTPDLITGTGGDIVLSWKRVV